MYVVCMHKLKVKEKIFFLKKTFPKSTIYCDPNMNHGSNMLNHFFIGKIQASKDNDQINHGNLQKLHIA